MALRWRCYNHNCRKVSIIFSWRTQNENIADSSSSDTVAPTLVFTFYELALHRCEQQKLFEELDSIDVYDSGVLRTLPHLNGVINESLRIHPPVPTGGYRQSPKGGMKIADKYIPGNVTIVAPRYTLGKRKCYLTIVEALTDQGSVEACFDQAEEYIPERWYSRREMIKDERAFYPFAQGRAVPSLPHSSRLSCCISNAVIDELTRALWMRRKEPRPKRIAFCYRAAD